MPARWQLEQDRAELVAQEGGPVQECPERLPGLLELLHVGEISAGLDGEKKVPGNLTSPCLHGFLCRQPVEGVVDFDRPEFFAIIVEEIAAPQVFGIKDPHPMPVMPSGGADMDLAGGPSG